MKTSDIEIRDALPMLAAQQGFREVEAEKKPTQYVITEFPVQKA